MSSVYHKAFMLVCCRTYCFSARAFWRACDKAQGSIPVYANAVCLSKDPAFPPVTTPWLLTAVHHVWCSVVVAEGRQV